MAEDILTDRVKETMDELGSVEIVVGVPSYNSENTIGSVMLAAHDGLVKYFAASKAVIVNSDGGSKDGTVKVVEETHLDTQSILSVSHPLYPVHRLTSPYHGLPGRGSAFRTLFRIAEVTQAKALAVVDADLRSITPEWFDLLLRPVLSEGYDYVAPYYKRHKFDGAITSSIVYPLTRALYGRRVRQPIGGDFGISGRLASRLLSKDIWGSEVARYGIDLWITITAIAENFRVCQAYLGAKVHDPKDPAPDLGSVLVQVVGSVFSLMETYDSVWRTVLGSLPTPSFGRPFEIGLEPMPLNLGPMLASFQHGVRDLLSVYQQIISAAQLKGLEAATSLPESEFAISDELWGAVIYDFALGYHRRVMDREHMVKALTPLYWGWVASFVRQAQDATASQIEGRIERLCLVFEQLKPYLINQWSLRGGKEEAKP